MNVWDCRKGQKFTVAEYPGDVFTFDHMDGGYSYAIRESDGMVLNWSGPVMPVVED
jgi:hypothetical protein